MDRDGSGWVVRSGIFSSVTGRLLCFFIWLIARIACSSSLVFSSMGLLDRSRFLSYLYVSMNFLCFEFKEKPAPLCEGKNPRKGVPANPRSYAIV